MQTHTPEKLKPGRRSTVATHPRRLEIELACAGRTSLRKVAADFGVSNSALDRHWNSLPTEYRDRLAAAASDLAQYEERVRAHFAALHTDAPSARCSQARPAKSRNPERAHA